MMGSLEEVHMPQNGINYPGITALAKAMQHNTGLRILNLNDNTFTEKGAVAMAQVQSVKNLVSLLLEFSIKLVSLILFSIYLFVRTKKNKAKSVKNIADEMDELSPFFKSLTITIIGFSCLLLVVY